MSAPTVERDAPAVTTLHVRRPRRRSLLRVLLVVVLLALAAAAVWAVWFSSLLAVREVRAVGVEGARADAVLAAAAVPVGQPLARVDTGRAERAILGLDWVSDVEVRRGWPTEVVVAVTAREPVAVLATGSSTPVPSAAEGAGRQAVDATGVVFEALGGTRGLPRVSAQGPALTEAMAVLASLPRDLARKVVAVSASTRDDVDLTLRSGDLVRWGSAERGEFKAEVLRALLNRKADVYDVSAPELPTTFRSR